MNSTWACSSRSAQRLSSSAFCATCTPGRPAEHKPLWGSEQPSTCWSQRFEWNWEISAPPPAVLSPMITDAASRAASFPYNSLNPHLIRPSTAPQPLPCPPFILLLLRHTFLRPLVSDPTCRNPREFSLRWARKIRGGGRTGQGGEGTFVFYFFMLTNIYFMLHEVAGVYLAGSNLGREERNVKISRNLLEAPPNQR